jgi:hypothetical protein
MAINFPTTPSTGQTYSYLGNVYQYDGEKWRAASGTAPAVNVQVFTADGTYTPTPGMRYCQVIATGAGGGGGGADTDGTGAAGAGGGESGGTAIKVYTASQLGATAAVVVGVGGPGGLDTGGNATAGEATTFTPAGGGSTLSAGGGGAGFGLSATVDANEAAGGTGGSTTTGGDLNTMGGEGGRGFSGPADGVSNPPFAYGGAGGIGYWGGGGSARARVTGGSIAGKAGTAYGSGGGGAAAVDTATGAAGGDGKAGVVYIEEYIGTDYGTSPIIDPLTELTVGQVDIDSDFLYIRDTDASLNKKIKPQYVGGMHLLASGSAAAAATLDFVLTSYTGYRAIKFVLTDTVSSSITNPGFWIRTSSNGGSSYDAGASDYGWNLIQKYGATFTSTGGATEDLLDSEIALGFGPGHASDNMQAEFTIYQQSSAEYKTIYGQICGVDAAATPWFQAGTGTRFSAADVDAIRFLYATGNITCNYAVYGLI